MTEDTPLRLLFTGARAETHRARVIAALSDASYRIRGEAHAPRRIVLVHGASTDFDGTRRGADWIADSVWTDWVGLWPHLFAPPERHPAADHVSPLARNLHMVNLGADGCCAIAHSWRSGTGHCARAARDAGIPTWDFGVPTAQPNRRRTA